MKHQRPNIPQDLYDRLTQNGRNRILDVIKELADIRDILIQFHPDPKVALGLAMSNRVSERLTPTLPQKQDPPVGYYEASEPVSEYDPNDDKEGLV